MKHRVSKKLLLILVIILIAIFPAIHYANKGITYLKEKKLIKEVKNCVNEYWRQRVIPRRTMYIQYPDTTIKCYRQTENIVFGFNFNEDMDTAFVSGGYRYDDESGEMHLLYRFKERYIKKNEAWIFDRITKNKRNLELEKSIKEF